MIDGGSDSDSNAKWEYFAKLPFTISIVPELSVAAQFHKNNKNIENSLYLKETV